MVGPSGKYPASNGKRKCGTFRIRLQKESGDGYRTFGSFRYFKNLYQGAESWTEDAGGYRHASASQSGTDFLDEPTLGLDVLAKQQMIRFLKKINLESKTTVVVTSHDMDDLEMAQRIILINKGRIAFDGDFDELRNVMGGFYRIVLTTTKEETPLSIPGMRLLKTESGVHEYEFDRNVLGIHEVMGLLSDFPQILDMEIKKAPIEDVVANLYLSWREN